MKLFGRKSDLEKRLVSARKDYDTALAKVEIIVARKNVAAETAETFAAWRVEYEAALGEMSRLETLVCAMMEGAEALKAHEAAEALRIRIDAARKVNAVVAQRMVTDGVRLVAEIKALVRDASAAVLEAAAVNAQLPRGVAPVADANFIARGTPAVPRAVLSESVVRLWAYATTGEAVNDQSAVLANNNDPETGVLNAGATVAGVACVKRDFRSVDVHPAEPPLLAEHLHSTVRLPNFDGPGIAIDGARLIIEHAAAIDTDPPKRSPPASSKRRVKRELTPIGPMPEFKTAIQLEHERLQEEQRQFRSAIG
jgi:hypothetical protein